MAKPPGAIGRKKREAAMTRRLERGRTKAWRKRMLHRNPCTNGNRHEKAQDRFACSICGTSGLIPMVWRWF